MKILVGKRFEGESDILFIPGRRRKLAPIMVRGVTKKNRREKVRAVLADLEAAPTVPQAG